MSEFRSAFCHHPQCEHASLAELSGDEQSYSSFGLQSGERDAVPNKLFGTLLESELVSKSERV